MGSNPQAGADEPGPKASIQPRVRLSTVLREWGRIGCIGFGGPPAHIALHRKPPRPPGRPPPAGSWTVPS